MPPAAGPSGHDLAVRVRAQPPLVTVAGDLVLDGWWTGRVDRVSREAPAPVVDLRDRHWAPGGAANTAANLAALGARVRVVGAVGPDEAGRRLVGLLADAGVDVSGIVVLAAARTLTKTRVVAGDQVLVRLDDATSLPTEPPAARRPLVPALQAALDGCDVLVVGDYGLGTLGAPERAAVAAWSRAGGGTLVDAHDVASWRTARPDVVTPNAGEVERLLGERLGPDRPAAVARHAGRILAASGARAAVVTLDVDGAVLLTADGGARHRTAAGHGPERHASGAGDTFAAALAVAVACGIPLPKAVEIGQAAADVVVRKAGTSVCTLAELVRRGTAPAGAAAGVDGGVGMDVLAAVLESDRAAGRRVVFTNGCFDVLHAGHVAYLQQARTLGDVLVVAVNSDESVRRLKGPGRPVHHLADRVAVLSALACVDHVLVFDTDTPIPVISRLCPDVYVKGGDYTPEMLEETAVVTGYGGEVRTLDYLEGRSTTAALQRVLAATRLTDGVPAS